MYLIASLLLLIAILFRNTIKSQSISSVAYAAWIICSVSFIFYRFFFTIDFTTLILKSVIIINAEWSTLQSVITIVYLVGIAGMATAGIISYCRNILIQKKYEPLEVDKCFHNKKAVELMEKASQKHVKILYGKEVATPYTFGIIRPRIVLSPSCLEENRQIDIILEHELRHIARKDCLWRIVGYTSLCMNWFNPVVWILFFQLIKDCEISLDYTICKSCDENYRKQYVDNLKNELLCGLNSGMKWSRNSFSIYYANHIKDRVLALKLGKEKAYSVSYILLIIFTSVSILCCHIHIQTGIRLLSFQLTEGHRITGYEYHGEGPDGADIDVIRSEYVIGNQ